jgi:hypothetical protein
MKRLLLGVLTLAVLASAATATADRPANPSEREGILTATSKFGLDANYCEMYPRGTCLLRVRVSTVNRHWAKVVVVSRSAQVQGGTNLVHKVAGVWRAHEGNGGGCIPPRRVREDLGLDCST